MYSSLLCLWSALRRVAAMFLITFLVVGGGLTDEAYSQGEEDTERNARVARVLRRLARERDEIERQGLVFKSPYFWQHFYDPRGMEALFYGHFEKRGLLTRSYVGQMTARFVVAKYSACSATMGSDLTYYKITTKETVRMNGSEYTRTVADPYVVGVSQAFLPHFEAEFRRPASLYDFFQSVKQLASQWDLAQLPGEYFRGTLGKYVNPHFDAPKFVRLVGCNTASLHQFEENLLRAIEGRAPVKNIPRASKESDSGFLQGRFSSLGEACYMDLLYRRDDVNDDKAIAFCSCSERALMTDLSQSQVMGLVGDYRALYRNKEWERKIIHCRK